jgi:tRNA(adenine34) deaminase
MKQALLEAKKASSSDEVPVGAVISHNSQIIGRGHNQTETSASVVHHAEMIAIQQASKHLQNWRLNECVLCVTLEPCTMCLGAIRLARIPVVVFGAGDSRQGAAGSLYDLSKDPRLGETPRVISGICSTECTSLLKEFFKGKRR